MNKENISLIINCQKEDIEHIDLSHFNDNYSRIYFNISPNDKEYLSKIINDIETEYFSIISIYEIKYYSTLSKDIYIKFLNSLEKITKKSFFYKKDIVLIALCYNELQILPFAIQYWKRICDKVIIYDNGSTDGTIEFLLKNEYKNFIEVRNFRYSNNNQINDAELTYFKNNIWKEFRNQYKWCIICDIDELFYIKNPSKFLEYINENNINAVKCNGYQLISTYWPNYDNNSLLHHLVKYGIKDKKYDKVLMFNINDIDEINYEPGAHLCNPVSNNLSVYQHDNVFLFHAKWITYQYVQNRYKKLSNKLSDFNVQNNYGIEYQFDKDKIKKIYMDLLDRCEFIDDWFDTQEIFDIDLIDNKKVKPYINNDCCVIVPIYKETLNEYENISLIQLLNVIQCHYDIIFIHPKSLKLEYYQNLPNTFFVELDDKYFKSVETYNQLCLNWKFYNKFSNYQYMLIYQLDAYINYNNLDYFISLNYDFIGALHYAPYFLCGNGGFSLRKNQSMINILKHTDIDYTQYEDIFINSKIINKTPENICRFFAICSDKEIQENILTHKPMGYHYYYK